MYCTYMVEVFEHLTLVKFNNRVTFAHIPFYHSVRNTESLYYIFVCTTCKI